MAFGDPDVYLKQLALKELGYYKGKLDGISGLKTRNALQAWFRYIDTSPISGPPVASYGQLREYFGSPADTGNLVYIDFPYKMFLAWDKSISVTKTRVHKKVAKPLLAALVDILAEYGEEGIKKHGLNLFGGVYNNRNTRGGKTKSLHAWGAAIDLNPAENGNRTPWDPSKIGKKGYGTMPLKVVEIFEKHGFKHGGRAWGRDSMHFQYTK